MNDNYDDEDSPFNNNDDEFFKRIDMFLRNYRVISTDMDLKEFGIPVNKTEVTIIFWCFDNNLSETYVN